MNVGVGKVGGNESRTKKAPHRKTDTHTQRTYDEKEQGHKHTEKKERAKYKNNPRLVGFGTPPVSQSIHAYTTHGEPRTIHHTPESSFATFSMPSNCKHYCRQRGDVASEILRNEGISRALTLTFFWTIKMRVFMA